MIKNYWILLILLSLNKVYSIEPSIVWIENAEERYVNCLQYSQDGKYLFVHSTERENGIKKTIYRQWDIKQKKVIKEFETKKQFSRMDVSTDMKTVVGSDLFSVEVADLDNNESKIFYPKSGKEFTMIFWLAISEDASKIFVFEYYYKNIQIYDSKTLEFTGEYIYNNLDEITTSFDKKYAGLISHSDTSFSFISLNDNKLINKFKIGKPAGGADNASISFDNNYVVINYDSTGYANNTEVYEIASGKLIANTKTNLQVPYSSFIKDNETIVISAYPYSKLSLWNFKSNEKTGLSNFNLSGNKLVASPVDNLLCSITNEEYFVIFDYNTKGIVFQENKTNTNLSQANNVYISKDSKYILAAGGIKNKGLIQKRDFLTGNLLESYFVIDNPIINMYVSEDEKLISIIDDYWTVYLLKLVDDKYVVDTQFPHEDGRPVESVISKDNKKLFYAGVKTGVVCYNLETGEKKVFDTVSLQIKSLALSSDNSKIIYGTYESYFGALEYNSEKDVYNRTYYVRLEKQDKGNSGISGVGFSPDNSIIFACAGDYKTYLMKFNDYSLIKNLSATKGWQSSSVKSACITNDNKKLLVFDSYSTIRIFDINSSKDLWYDDSLGTHNGVEFNRISSIKLSSDNKYFIISYYEGTLALVAVNDSTTSVEDRQFYDCIVAHPNPAKEYLFIKSTKNPELSESMNLQLFDMLGNPVSGIYPLFGNDQINIEHLTPGMYFIKIGDKIEKFVKI